MTGSLQLDITILIVALVFSALFSSSETALTALSETKARQLMEEKRRGARWLSLWLERPNRVLTTILIGNNVVNTFTAAAATLVAQQVFDNSALSIAVAITTIAILVVGEITPKTFAKHNAERVAPASMLLVMPLYFACYPVVIAFTWLSKSLVRLTGGDVTRTGPFITEEDVAYMIKLGQSEGVFEAHETTLLENVFEFGDTVVKEVMVPSTDLNAISADSTIDKIFDSIREHGHTRVPVFVGNIDEIVGVFHTKELMHIVRTESEHTFKLEDNLREAFFVPELMKIGEVLKEFQRRKTHLAIVVDEYGGTAGIICLEDILEEIVGEIRDEYDDAEDDEFRRIDDDHWLANGRASIYELGEALQIDFPEGGAYETLGGFLISEWGRMPPPAARISFGGWIFRVKDADNRRVNRVAIDRVGSRKKEKKINQTCGQSMASEIGELPAVLKYEDEGDDAPKAAVVPIDRKREKA